MQILFGCVYILQVLNGMQSNNTSDPVNVFTLTGLKAKTQYSIYTVGTYISNEMQESPPLIIQTERKYCLTVPLVCTTD